ncbi:MAG: MarR family transcriptional regulator [Alphaproteobacteria bacterium]|nr:MarR family transcriptional regulator [Alphaproteobacteria bacterium]
MVETKPGTNLLFLRDEDLRQGIELLFFAYRDFTAEADAILAKQKFGRAHHRVIYFVGQYPGMSVSDLLDILSITKQSLSRVLRQLVDEGYIDQQPGTTDRRQRLLTLTTKGKELEGLLTSEQRARIAAAYKNAGADAVEGFRKVMLGIMEGSARRRFNEDET